MAKLTKEEYMKLIKNVKKKDFGLNERTQNIKIQEIKTQEMKEHMQMREKEMNVKEQDLYIQQLKLKKEQELKLRWANLKEIVYMADNDPTLNDALTKLEMLYALKKEN